MLLSLPAVVQDLWTAQQALVQFYGNTGLRFTLDGRLVGDIAETVALHHFDLVAPKKRTKGVDAFTRTGRSVQVKATGQADRGPAFTPASGVADHLLFFQFDFAAGTASVVYNGPEAPVRGLAALRSGVSAWEGNTGRLARPPCTAQSSLSPWAPSFLQARCLNQRQQFIVWHLCCDR
ncbi:DUF6998 domain-containing protein [Cupriavidus necator]|uniref:DUF6998 domain-containing protein n=1 Tax=Cupriavidus necator TaxID=106590 RepID=UPI0039C3766F